MIGTPKSNLLLSLQKNIYTEFSSGESGAFDMTPYMKSIFFSALHNEEYFRRAHLEFGVITWPNMRLEMVSCKWPKGIELKTATNIPTVA